MNSGNLEMELRSRGESKIAERAKRRPEPGRRMRREGWGRKAMTPDERKDEPGRILLVSDDKRALDSLAQMLCDEFPVETASSCTEGLASLHLFGPFAVIAADARMAGLDGVDFLAHVRSLSPPTVGILLAGRRDLQRATAAQEAGQVFRVLAKPCEREDLLDTVRRAMDRYRAHLEAIGREQEAWTRRFLPSGASLPQSSVAAK